jgi:sigma-B regulation protein RsbU (phosphoserine phosphatase)
MVGLRSPWRRSKSMSMKILIAEDDLDARELLALTLEHEGHQVVRASNGLEALRFFQDESFPLIISDWLMPEMDGIQLCQEVRALNRTPYAYILLLTALHGKANYLEGIRAGADDFMSKPYDPDELKARLTVAARIMHLQEHIKKLEGILPTCMYCKRIRERDNWIVIEEYIAARTEASFSHGVCPECYEKVMRAQHSS